MSTQIHNRSEKIHALTSLRFFASLYVVLYHTLGLAFPNVTAVQAVHNFLSLGYISVSFFFLLSGYILAVVYLRNGAAVRRKSFYVARFARVYPLFFFTLVADTPFVLISRMQQFGVRSGILRTIATFMAHVFMLQAWLPGLRGIDQPNWSLSVEAVFYLTFPLIGVALWKLRGARFWLAAVVIWLASQVLVTLVAPHVSEPTVRFEPVLHLGTFALGILVARWQYLKRERVGQGSTAAGRATSLVVAGAVYAAVVYWVRWVPMPNLNSGLLSPVFAVVIWACSANESGLARLLSAKFLVVLGEASFGLYLIHIPVLHLMEALHWEHSQRVFPLYLGTCIGLSVCSFYWVETPMRKWILERFRTRPKETLETASDAQ